MSYTLMKRNNNIADKEWEQIAKSIYDESPIYSKENRTSDEKELFTEEKEQLLKMASQVDLYFNLKKYNGDSAWENIKTKIHQHDSSGQTKVLKLLSSPFFRTAAAVLFAAILLVSGYGIFHTPPATVEMLEISATNRVLNTFSLSDGTLVTLNTDTKLKYPKKFNQKNREVSIEGEAFFEVKPNKNKPFIIHAGKAEIKVIGTSFNVSAYPETKLVEVIVETGQVQVLNKTTETKQTNELILVPGDKGTLVYSSNSLLKTTNQDPNFLAWKTHHLIFKATSLFEVIGNLEKVYKVNIRLADPKLNGLLLTAQFNDYPLDFILKVIESTFKIEVQNMNGQYILKAKS